MAKRICKTPIGIFDSGVGGLSVLNELDKLMPVEHYIYYADTKNIPYGDKSQEDIIKFGREILNFFLFKGVQHVIIACNTSSALSYNVLKQEFPSIKIYPLIQSVAKNLAKYNNLAVLATEATVNSGKYASEIKKYNRNAEVNEIPCPGFTEIVENGLYNSPTTLELIDDRFELLGDVDKIVLGCTHYPYLLNTFDKFIDKENFIDPAKIFAKVIFEDIQNENQGVIFDLPKREFYVSDNPDKFKENAKIFYEIKEEVQLV
ncbi:MAG: glutamate racemase [Cyanobacteria bacterium SIG30]|nr:glutamate racemase [Cyanobacteria bacterium SIG30]